MFSERASRAPVLGLFAAVLLTSAAVAPAQAPATPENPHGTLAIGCAECHTVEGWSPLKNPLPFDHGETTFRLGGAHAAATCKTCHTSLVFDEASPDCASCHAAEAERVREPDHRDLPKTCQSCHGDQAWQPVTSATTSPGSG